MLAGRQRGPTLDLRLRQPQPPQLAAPQQRVRDRPAGLVAWGSAPRARAAAGPPATTCPASCATIVTIQTMNCRLSSGGTMLSSRIRSSSGSRNSATLSRASTRSPAERPHRALVARRQVLLVAGDQRLAHLAALVGPPLALPAGHLLAVAGRLQPLPCGRPRPPCEWASAGPCPVRRPPRPRSGPGSPRASRRRSRCCGDGTREASWRVRGWTRGAVGPGGVPLRRQATRLATAGCAHPPVGWRGTAAAGRHDERARQAP